MPKIKLLVDHVHADTEYPSGAELIVDDSTAKWLTDNGHGIVVAAPQPVPKPHPKPDMSEEDN